MVSEVLPPHLNAALKVLEQLAVEGRRLRGEQCVSKQGQLVGIARMILELPITAFCNTLEGRLATCARIFGITPEHRDWWIIQATIEHIRKQSDSRTAQQASPEDSVVVRANFRKGRRDARTPHDPRPAA